MSRRNFGNYILRNFLRIDQRTHYYSTVPKLKGKKGPLLISCKRPEYNHHLETFYDKLDEVPLCSKGWTHSKAKNDYFTVLPIPDEYEQETYSFMEFGINSLVIDALKEQGIKTATEFQAKAIVTLQRGKSILGVILI